MIIFWFLYMDWYIINDEDSFSRMVLSFIHQSHTACVWIKDWINRALDTILHEDDGN